MNVEIFAYIARGSWITLILLKKKAKERTIAHDKLSFTASQYATEIYQPHIIRFICGLYANPNHIYLEVNGTK